MNNCIFPGEDINGSAKAHFPSGVVEDVGIRAFARTAQNGEGLPDAENVTGKLRHQHVHFGVRCDGNDRLHVVYISLAQDEFIQGVPLHGMEPGIARLLDERRVRIHNGYRSTVRSDDLGNFKAQAVRTDDDDLATFHAV